MVLRAAVAQSSSGDAVATLSISGFVDSPGACGTSAGPGKKGKEAYSSLCYKHLTAMGTHVPYGSHSVTCHQAEVTFPPLPQPMKAGTRFSDPRGRGQRITLCLHIGLGYSLNHVMIAIISEKCDNKLILFDLTRPSPVLIML